MSFRDLVSQTQDIALVSLGEEIIYHRPDGVFSKAIRGIFDAAATLVLIGNEPGISSTAPVVGVKLTDLPDAQKPAKGDYVTIRETEYDIVDSQEDGQDWFNLILQKRAAA